LRVPSKYGNGDSAVVIVLPLSVLLSFIGIRYVRLSSNIMSLGGIAIAIGELADAAIVLIENAHVRLAAASPGADRKRVIVDACKEVGRPIFFSLLLITVSFLPIFTLAGQAGDCSLRWPTPRRSPCLPPRFCPSRSRRRSWCSC
jgi:Cu/Ag efflux pump CusA